MFPEDGNASLNSPVNQVPIERAALVDLVRRTNIPSGNKDEFKKFVSTLVNTPVHDEALSRVWDSLFESGGEDKSDKCNGESSVIDTMCSGVIIELESFANKNLRASSGTVESPVHQISSVKSEPIFELVPQEASATACEKKPIPKIQTKSIKQEVDKFCEKSIFFDWNRLPVDSAVGHVRNSHEELNLNQFGDIDYRSIQGENSVFNTFRFTLEPADNNSSISAQDKSSPINDKQSDRYGHIIRRPIENLLGNVPLTGQHGDHINTPTTLDPQSSGNFHEILPAVEEVNGRGNFVLGNQGAEIGKTNVKVVTPNKCKSLSETLRDIKKSKHKEDREQTSSSINESRNNLTSKSKSPKIHKSADQVSLNEKVKKGKPSKESSNKYLNCSGSFESDFAASIENLQEKFKSASSVPLNKNLVHGNVSLKCQKRKGKNKKNPGNLESLDNTVILEDITDIKKKKSRKKNKPTKKISVTGKNINKKRKKGESCEPENAMGKNKKTRKIDQREDHQKSANIITLDAGEEMSITSAKKESSSKLECVKMKLLGDIIRKKKKKARKSKMKAELETLKSVVEVLVDQVSKLPSTEKSVMRNVLSKIRSPSTVRTKKSSSQEDDSKENGNILKEKKSKCSGISCKESYVDNNNAVLSPRKARREESIINKEDSKHKKRKRHSHLFATVENNDEMKSTLEDNDESYKYVPTGKKSDKRKKRSKTQDTVRQSVVSVDVTNSLYVKLTERDQMDLIKRKEKNNQQLVSANTRNKIAYCSGRNLGYLVGIESDFSETRGQFMWKETIVEILRAYPNGLPYHKLQRKVIKKYSKVRGRISQNTAGKFERYLSRICGVTFQPNLIKYTESPVR